MKRKIILSILLITTFLFCINVNAETEILYGDVDGNGVVEIKDATLIDKYLTDDAELDYAAQVRADVDRDNKVTRNDSKLITAYLEDKIDLPVKMGDVNEDGVIDETDAAKIEEYSADNTTFTDAQKLKADVNVDNYVDVQDSAIIQKYLTGKINTLPNIDGKEIIDPSQAPTNDKQAKEESEENINNPKTGNMIYIYVIAFLLVSGIAVFVTHNYRKKLSK